VMQLSLNGTVLSTRLFAVAPQNPSLFVAEIFDGGQICKTVNEVYGGTILQALAINEDGTLNSCANPAKAGSLISLFVNGIGTSAGTLSTGILTGLNPGYLSAPAEVSVGNYSAEVDSYGSQPGAISGIAQLNVRIPETISTLTPESAVFVTATLNNLPV